jgi:tetraacyldisaccharide 4'-kinase
VTAFIVDSWYRGAAWLYLLWPLSLLYRLVIFTRRLGYRLGFFHTSEFPVPVIIVGNITVGGTGKTPLVIALVKELQKAGFKPGVISRGYGSQSPEYPFHVTSDCLPQESGDEPLLIALRAKVPVVIDAKRSYAATVLLEEYDCDVIISDDGLQHYSLARTLEIAVIDSQRRLGNQQCLPAGPLREPVSRLDSVDFIIHNGAGDSLNRLAQEYTMLMQATALLTLDGSRSLTFEEWNESNLVHAVAAIGNPERFFNTLRGLGFTVIEHAFPDHHLFSVQDVQFDDGLPVIMTEKDAVKIRNLSIKHSPAEGCYWYLPITALIEDAFFQAVVDRIRRKPS